MTNEQLKRPIQRLRAALMEAGFTKLGGYTEYKGVYTLYVGRALYMGRACGQRKVINTAKRLGFKHVMKSGPTSIGLPKRKKSSAVIKKNTPSAETCVVLKKHIRGLFNGITPNVRMEIMKSVIKQLDPKTRKAFILSLVRKRTIRK